MDYIGSCRIRISICWLFLMRFRVGLRPNQMTPMNFVHNPVYYTLDQNEPQPTQSCHLLPHPKDRADSSTELICWPPHRTCPIIDKPVDNLKEGVPGKDRGAQNQKNQASHVPSP